MNLFIDSLEPERYGGVYFKEGATHILAVGKFYLMLSQKVSEEYHIVGLGSIVEPDAQMKNGLEVVIDEAFPITEEQKSSIAQQLAVKNLRFVLGAEDNPNTQSCSSHHAWISQA